MTFYHFSCKTFLLSVAMCQRALTLEAKLIYVSMKRRKAKADHLSQGILMINAKVGVLHLSQCLESPKKSYFLENETILYFLEPVKLGDRTTSE